jgi:hypothetical protein
LRARLAISFAVCSRLIRGVGPDTRAAALLLASTLIACSPGHDSAELGSEWQLRARVEFVESDFKTARAALAPASFYLAFPFIGGDLYGVPTTDDLVRVKVEPDYPFVLDLTTSERFARRAARPAAIGEGRVHGRPTALGLARVATFTMDPETDQRAGLAAWSDASGDGNLVLAYLDRPGRILGALTEEAHEYRFDISVEKEGYAWLRRRKIAENVSEMVVSEWPKELVLRVAPLRY